MAEAPRPPARSFSKARLTGAHMQLDKNPDLLSGETFIATGAAIDQATLYNNKGIVVAEEGTIWATNYRTIFRFYVSENVLTVERHFTIFISSISFKKKQKHSKDIDIKIVFSILLKS